jgi:hypothetical protein
MSWELQISMSYTKLYNSRNWNFETSYLEAKILILFNNFKRALIYWR